MTAVAGQTVELPIGGMDCAECARTVRDAIARTPGVQTVEVLLASEKAVVRYDPAVVAPLAIQTAIESAGYRVAATRDGSIPAGEPSAARVAETGFVRPVLALFGVVFALVLIAVVGGEWFGLFAIATARVPWPVGAAIVAALGFPVFRNVARAARRGKIISHTMMTLGVVAALAVGQWPTAALVAVFMRAGDFAERFTTERSRQALRRLTTIAPATARVERDGREIEIPVAEVRRGEVVVVRPGERIPVDGVVTAGQATIDQAAITGESMPAEAAPGSPVYAATIATLGSLRVRAEKVGADTTFGRVVRLVEEAETHRADVQRIGDRFAALYLPVVAAIAALTLLLRRDPLAMAAVLVVACSCSFALATPIAMLASVGAAAQRGILVKGGKYLETLARVDLLLIDKTGTLTLGRPRITDVVPLGDLAASDLLAIAAASERDSEHPLAAAVRAAAAERGIVVGTVEAFAAAPGGGVRAVVGGREIAVGNRRWLGLMGDDPQAAALEAAGKSTLVVIRDGAAIGLLAAADPVRPEVPAALASLRALGIGRIELLTGDNPRAAAALADPLGIPYRAGLLPEDKIAAVREAQARGLVVAMVGDGVNDAPALAQADVGIAMGAAGSDVAIEAAHVALLRDDWRLVPEAFAIARRTMRVVRGNIAFTAVYNVAGLALAAFGFLPPIFAAAAQSLPDIGILANSSRLLRSRD